MLKNKFPGMKSWILATKYSLLNIFILCVCVSLKCFNWCHETRISVSANLRFTIVINYMKDGNPNAKSIVSFVGCQGKKSVEFTFE